VLLARAEVTSGNASAPAASADPFLDAHAARPLDAAQRVTALKLLEMQRHALLMYTSCGWFFDDISGIETVQIIAYAGRVVQLAAEVFGAAAAGLEEGFVERLRAAKSNDPEAKDGGEIYLRQVRKAQVGLEEVAAHYAISSVFTSYPEETRLFGYSVRRLDAEWLATGRTQVVLGRALVGSLVTGELEPVSYAVLHFGDQNITAAVKRSPEGLAEAEAAAEAAIEREAHAALLTAVRAAAGRADVPAIVRLFDRHFGESVYSIASLFNDEERRILKIILEPTLAEIETTFAAIYDRHASLLGFLSQAGMPKPAELVLAAGSSINSGLRRALEKDPVDEERVRLLLARAKEVGVALDEAVLGYAASQRMKRAMLALYAHPGRLAALDRAVGVAEVLAALPFEIRLWQAQNIWYEIHELSRRRTLAHEPEEAATWLTRFHTLGRRLHIAVDVLVLEDDGVGPHD